ncbi:MAG: hypothetical protein WAW96_06975 [Alphaproteobacteria bacterium]
MNVPLPAGDFDQWAAPPMPRNILLVASLFTVPYRVLRTAAACGVNVHVLGGPRANGLRFSRFCASFDAARRDPASADTQELTDEINAVIAKHEIDLVLPGDQPTTRQLILAERALDCPTFPGPTLQQFDLLNDKWDFTKLCQRLAILVPDSELLADKMELKQGLLGGEIGFPVVAKPIDLDGQRGIVELFSSADLGKIESIGYAPVLVQRYIDGQDVGASIYCEDGKIKALIVHTKAGAIYRTFRHPQIEHDLKEIAAAMRITGVYNFDMRVTPQGDVYWFGCNPHFFFKMFLSMLAGLNFVAFGLAGASSNAVQYAPDGSAVRLLKALAATLAMPWRLSKRDFAYAGERLADPLPFIRESLRIDWEGSPIERTDAFRGQR